SWADILKTKQVRPDFPFIGFGSQYFSITDLCVEGDTVRVADPARDPGVRLAARTLPGQWPVSPSAEAPTRSAAVASVAATSESPIRYRVRVYKAFSLKEPVHLYLFEKEWDIRSCPGS